MEKDGACVAHMLLEAARSHKYDSTSLVRTFLSRTVMFRQSNFPELATMLAAIIGGGSNLSSTTCTVESQVPESVTEGEARSMATAFLHIIFCKPIIRTATEAVEKLLEAFVALREMDVTHKWLAPMLQVIAEWLSANGLDLQLQRAASVKMARKATLPSATTRVTPEDSVAGHEHVRIYIHTHIARLLA